MNFHKKKFWLIFLGLCIFGLAVLVIAGCSQNGQDVSMTIPRTPEEAGIEVLDSSHCEACHLSAETISSFEKPKTDESAGESGG